MANSLGNYNPIFYASEALIQLEKALGMAARVHRGYELERRAVNIGQTISIRRPSTFTAQDPISSSQDLATQVVNITLSQNPGVRFELTDLELAYTGEQVITEHIRPAAYAIADKIDQYLVALYKDVPWLYDYTTATDHTIITGAKSVAFNNAVPMDDGMLHMMVDGTVQMHFENSVTFHSAQVTGAGQNQTLFRGGLGKRFGVEVFGNQNVATHVPGTALQTAGDNVLAVNSNPLAKGATTMDIDGGTAAETFVAGDTFVIAGNSQRYALTADVTLTTGAATGVTFTPAAVQQYADGAVITFTKMADAGAAQQLFFHRNAFALAMAPLPDNLPGIEAFTASEPTSGLSLRARRWSDGVNAKTYVALDALLGVKCLDPNLAVRAFT